MGLIVRCYYCGGDTAEGIVTDLYAEDAFILAVRNVPAYICRQCGEWYYKPEVTRRLLSLTEQARERAQQRLPGQNEEIAICDFREAAAAGS